MREASPLATRRAFISTAIMCRWMKLAASSALPGARSAWKSSSAPTTTSITISETRFALRSAYCGSPSSAPVEAVIQPMPVQSWQIWSEPNFANFDPGGTVASAAQKYARLLQISDGTINEVDPSATIVLAGMPGFAQWPAWAFLDKLYEDAENEYLVWKWRPVAA